MIAGVLITFARLLAHRNWIVAPPVREMLADAALAFDRPCREPRK
jgi:hypothetical protein